MCDCQHMYSVVVIVMVLVRVLTAKQQLLAQALNWNAAAVELLVPPRLPHSSKLCKLFQSFPSQGGLTVL